MASSDAFLGFLLIELFAFALCWLGILVGLIAKSSQLADVLINIPVFLLGFISNVFVDTSKMPVWLRVFANWNPVSSVVAAGRNLFGNTIGPPPSGGLVARASGDHDHRARRDHHRDLRAALRPSLQPHVAMSGAWRALSSL